jgi:hypothetical protein
MVSPTKSSVESVMQFAREKNRICPQPQRWNELWDMLPDKQRAGGGWSPPLPLILGAWWHTSDSEKQERFLSHIQYAAEHGALEQVHRFLKSLAQDQWYYGG